MVLLRSGYLCEKKFWKPRCQTQDTLGLYIDCSCPGCAVSISGSIGETAVTLLFPIVSLNAGWMMLWGWLELKGPSWKASTSFSMLIAIYLDDLFWVSAICAVNVTSLMLTGAGRTTRSPSLKQPLSGLRLSYTQNRSWPLTWTYRRLLHWSPWLSTLHLSSILQII